MKASHEFTNTAQRKLPASTALQLRDDREVAIGGWVDRGAFET